MRFRQVTFLPEIQIVGIITKINQVALIVRLLVSYSCFRFLASATESVEMNWIWWRENTNRPYWDIDGISFQPKETWLGKGLHFDMKPTKQPADLQGDYRNIYMYQMRSNCLLPKA